MSPRLDRHTWSASGPPGPVRMVHLGLGAFHRSHQAWYTAHAGDAEHWGIAAFTGRRPDAAVALASQDGLYTLVERGAEGDRLQVVGSIAAAHDGSDRVTWTRHLADPEVAVVTLTVTEAGYHLDPAGRLDLTHPSVAADLVLLCAETAPSSGLSMRPATMPGRLAAGLAARRRADAGPLTVVPCDNLRANDAATRAAVVDLCRAADPSLAEWVASTVSFAATVVDRITPATTPGDTAAVAHALHLEDRAVVVAEPFAEWVLAGSFPAGRPAWESAGALVVDDVAPFAERKLWLLNGAHSLLAYAGLARGHATVAQAMADPAIRSWLEQWWDDATPALRLPPGEVTAYRAALAERFANPRIAHALAQIARDGSLKLAERVAPVVRWYQAAGRPAPLGAARIYGAWLAHLRRAGPALSDLRADELTRLAAGPVLPAARAVLEATTPGVGVDRPFSQAVVDAYEELGKGDAP